MGFLQKKKNERKHAHTSYDRQVFSSQDLRSRGVLGSGWGVGGWGGGLEGAGMVVGGGQKV